MHSYDTYKRKKLITAISLHLAYKCLRTEDSPRDPEILFWLPLNLTTALTPYGQFIFYFLRMVTFLSISTNIVLASEISKHVFPHFQIIRPSFWRSNVFSNIVQLVSRGEVDLVFHVFEQAQHAIREKHRTWCCCSAGISEEESEGLTWKSC